METLFGLLILYGAAATPFIIWGALVAQHRGRHEAFGVVLGFLFGPLGVAMAWLLPPNRNVLLARRRDEELIIAAAIRWAAEQRLNVKP
jgi:hypothetical protein